MRTRRVLGDQEGLGDSANQNMGCAMTKAGDEEISEQDFMQKIAGVPKQAGCSVIRSAVTLYVLLRASNVPLWAKVSIVATLAYFISPIDAIPDFLPGGYIDDMAAMSLLLAQLDVFKDDEVLERVEQLLPRYCRSKLIDSPP